MSRRPMTAAATLSLSGIAAKGDDHAQSLSILLLQQSSDLLVLIQPESKVVPKRGVCYDQQRRDSQMANSDRQKQP